MIAGARRFNPDSPAPGAQASTHARAARIIVGILTGKFAEKLALVHAVLKGLAAVNEHHRYFVGKLAAQLVVAVDVNLLPAKTAAAFELHQSFLDDLAEVAALARVDDHFSQRQHQPECSKDGRMFPTTSHRSNGRSASRKGNR